MGEMGKGNTRTLRDSQGNRFTRRHWVDQTIYCREWSRIYRVEYWADYMFRDTRHRVLLSLWGNEIILIISYKSIVLWLLTFPQGGPLSLWAEVSF